MGEYTKGPWEYGEYSEDNACGFYVRPIDRLKSDVAQIDWYQSTTRSMDEHEANARLIAAAPDQNESLIEMVDAVMKLLGGKPVRDIDERLLRANKAIAKAKGES